jgi:hypothetical protein
MEVEPRKGSGMPSESSHGFLFDRVIPKYITLMPEIQEDAKQGGRLEVGPYLSRRGSTFLGMGGPPS